MSWLLDAELSLYDWSNSSFNTASTEAFGTLEPVVTCMSSPGNTLPSPQGRILPRLTSHGKLASSSQQSNSDAVDVFARSRSILRQAAEKNLEPVSEISCETCDSHESGEAEGGEEEREEEREERESKGKGRGKGGAVRSSSDRLDRRREQNRRAAVNCRRRKKERATNSLMEYQKFQCSNTELSHEVRQLTEARNRLFQQLTSLCQRCASLTSPLPTPGTHDCDD